MCSTTNDQNLTPADNHEFPHGCVTPDSFPDVNGEQRGCGVENGIQIGH